ncbi:MAG: 4-hydroxy-3-methylbut-2-enyl diphosphate reductase [Bacteroidales bacterium]|nr:4-hydroxy-3-methylbut-2-enyl diphosphate reductase [Bacteroidales bacterium]
MPKKIVVDQNSGFCFGVINAIRTAEKYLMEHQTLYCLGDIVHNSEEVQRLSGMGLKIIDYDQFKSLQDTTVLIRAHGEPPETYRIAEKNNIRLIDATCPVVLKLQKRILGEYQENKSEKQILIYGKKGHAEVVGLLGQTNNTGIVISTPEDVDCIDFNRPSILYSQTTQSLEQYQQLISTIQERYQSAGHADWFEYKDTICGKVSSRAKQIADFASSFDVILFVSGEKSSNGLYLYNICKDFNPRSFFLTNVEQLHLIDLSQAESIGICGATSTPMWLMQQLADECAKL